MVAEYTEERARVWGVALGPDRVLVDDRVDRVATVDLGTAWTGVGISEVAAVIDVGEIGADLGGEVGSTVCDDLHAGPQPPEQVSAPVGLTEDVSLEARGREDVMAILLGR